MPGTLTVQSAEGTGLSYVLSDANERVVLGPLVLQRTDKEPTLSLCSSVSPLPLSTMSRLSAGAPACDLEEEPPRRRLKNDMVVLVSVGVGCAGFSMARGSCIAQVLRRQTGHAVL